MYIIGNPVHLPNLNPTCGVALNYHGVHIPRQECIRTADYRLPYALAELYTPTLAACSYPLLPRPS